MIELMSGRQLAEAFPLPAEGTDSNEVGWYMLLSRWRSEGKMKQREHYRQYPENGRLCWVYVPAKVVLLICTEATKAERPRPRITYLYETYYDQFCKMLQTRAFSMLAITAINAQEEPPSV